MTAVITTDRTITSHRSTTPQVRALNALLSRPVRELEDIYVKASVPRIGDVHGDLRGRMLAWPILEESPFASSVLRAFAGSKGFPWRGKSFMPKTADTGDGINRVFSERLKLFRFETFIAKSRAGDFDALQLDYDLHGNPPVIRSIKDEIREVEPGLWLGQAYYARPGKSPWLWLYFGLAIQ